MSDLRHTRNFHVFRQQNAGVWAYMGEEWIESSTPIHADDVSQLVVRAFMGRSRNAGGVFAVVPVDEWKLVDARRTEPEVKPSSASMVKVAT